MRFTRRSAAALTRSAVAGALLTGALLTGAQSAAADCVSSGGTTICSQGDVRGSSDPYYPYPCEDDWFCRSGNGGIAAVPGTDGGSAHGWQPRRWTKDLAGRFS